VGGGEASFRHDVEPLPRDSVCLRVQPKLRVVEDVHPPVDPPADDQQPAAVRFVIEPLWLEAVVDPVRIPFEVDQKKTRHRVGV
jgi:hypothetical protein